MSSLALHCFQFFHIFLFFIFPLFIFSLSFHFFLWFHLFHFFIFPFFSIFCLSFFRFIRFFHFIHFFILIMYSLFSLFFFRLLSKEDNQNGSIACAVAVPVSGQADVDDMWMTRGANKTNVTRQGIKHLNLSHPDASTMKGFAVTQRCNTRRELMVLHEFDPSEVFINTSHPNRLSRPLIRTDTSVDRGSRAFHCIHHQLS